MSDLDDLARAFAQLASDAGRLVMEVYATDFEVRTKGDLSPVSEADERADLDQALPRAREIGELMIMGGK